VENRMTYMLATAGTQMRWYVPPLVQSANIDTLAPWQVALLDHLDLNVVPGFGNKTRPSK
jgi:hypothetical protein